MVAGADLRLAGEGCCPGVHSSPAHQPAHSPSHQRPHAVRQGSDTLPAADVMALVFPRRQMVSLCGFEPLVRSAANSHQTTGCGNRTRFALPLTPSRLSADEDLPEARVPRPALCLC